MPSSFAGAALATPGVLLLPSRGIASPQTAPAAGPYTPAQIRQAYGFNNITFNNGTVAGDGSGQTIAIVDAYDDPNISGDLHAFDARFGLPDPKLTVTRQTVNGQPPATDPSGSWAGEAALDVEWAHAMAPGANILLVEADDGSETNLLSAAQWAATQAGVSVVSMSFGLAEDPSETSLDSLFTTPSGPQGVTFVAASGDQGTVTYPAASPNVLGVGGTSLALDGSGNYLAETAWSGSGGGLSAYEREPEYQQSVQRTGRRSSPDVAYNASPNSGYWVYDSFNNRQDPWQVVGGTSAGAPQWAALIAIADQGRALHGLGTLDGASQTLPLLYSMPDSNFHDITSGSNANYSAGPSYDMVTGRGSPYADRIVAALAQEPMSLKSLSAQASTESSPVPPTANAPSPGAQPPVSQPPSAQQPVAPSPFDAAATDALFVVQGLESDNLFLILLSLEDFESVFFNSSAAIQPQLQQVFFDAFVFDLL